MKLAAFDVETRGIDVGYGLQPWRVRSGEAWLTMAAVATDAGASGWMKPNVEQLRGFLQRMAKTKTRIVGWNTPFDMGWLLAMGLRDEVYACDWLDGMLVWKHLTASPPWTKLAPTSYGLKACVAQHLPDFAGYEQDINFETDDPEELERLFDYNKLDATYTLALTRRMWKQLTPAQHRCALIEAATLPMVAEAYVEGVAGNRAKASALSLALENTAKVEMVKLTISTSEPIDASVLASPTKLRKLLFEDWGLPITKSTVNGNASTDRDSLSQLADYDPRAAMLNNYREAMNNRTKFAEGMIASLDYNGDGMVRPNPRMYGTYTGRMSYGSKILRGKDERPTGVPLHQWKRGFDYRDLIEAPEGYDLLEFDFAGQEYRWMAVLSRDPTMLAMCEPGQDGHSYLGAKIARLDYLEFKSAISSGDSVTKDQRQLGKVGNLSCQYRTGASTLERVARVQFGVALTQQEAKAIVGTYRVTYPNVPRYWAKQIAFAKTKGYVETVAGRRVQLGIGGSPVPDMQWGYESTAINSPIQGAGADQKYLALMVMKDYLPSVGGRFYMELHDGIFAIVPKQHSEKARADLKQLLSNLPYKKAWGIDLPILFPVDSKIGPSWGQLKEII